MRKRDTKTGRTYGDLTNLESTKLGNKHVIVPSMPASEEFVLENFAIVSVYDSFLFAWT